MHDAAYAYVREAVRTTTVPDGPVVEIGARNINGTVRDLFPGRSYVGVDDVPGDGVDVVANGAEYQPPTPPAIVVCTETLEHTSEAEAICRQVARILAPGGVFIVTAAGDGRAPHSAIDGGPLRPGEYYDNVGADQLRQWLSDFDHVRIQINPGPGDIYATAMRESA